MREPCTLMAQRTFFVHDWFAYFFCVFFSRVFLDACIFFRVQFFFFFLFFCVLVDFVFLRGFCVFCCVYKYFGAFCVCVFSCVDYRVLSYVLGCICTSYTADFGFVFYFVCVLAYPRACVSPYMNLAEPRRFLVEACLSCGENWWENVRRRVGRDETGARMFVATWQGGLVDYGCLSVDEGLAYT